MCCGQLSALVGNNLPPQGLFAANVKEWTESGVHPLCIYSLLVDNGAFAVTSFSGCNLELQDMLIGVCFAESPPAAAAHSSPFVQL